MSAKYRKVKQADEALPAPLRWLTRAFSSITLSVILLCGVALYGTLASVPIFFIVLGAGYLAVVAVCLGAAGWAARRILGRETSSHAIRVTSALAVVALGIAAAVAGCYGVYHLATSSDWLMQHRTTVVYRLAWLDMNEPDFYAWWPFKTLLALFVVNMVWATIRRIEFKFVNLGVLTVHTGIVIMAMGAVVYGSLKIEGDTLLMRQDMGGYPVAHFYDRNTAALFLSVDNAPEAGFPLPDLPRYHDHAEGELGIALHERDRFGELFGDELRVTIDGFYGYAELVQRWKDASELENFRGPDLGPALVLQTGDRDGPHDAHDPFTLVASRPAQRVVVGEGFELEYLHAPPPERVEALRDPTVAAHVLRVEVPEVGYRKTLAVQEGVGYALGLTGLTLEVRDLGPYDMPFVTDGYQGATDTQATVHVSGELGGEAKEFTRIALHRYPERSQDFMRTGAANEGPMGMRQDPDPAVRITYLDNTRPQYRLITAMPEQAAPQAASATPEELWLSCRIPGVEPFMVPLPGDVTGAKFPFGRTDQASWLHVVDRLNRAVPVREPVAVPVAKRDPKVEGTHEQAALAVRVDYPLHDERLEPTGEVFSTTVYLRQMPYIEHAEGDLQPAYVSIPGYGSLKLSFGRERHPLPFAVALAGFEMTPYPGSDIPRDFASDLIVTPVTAEGRLSDKAVLRRPHLNNPVVFRSPGASLPTRSVKISQAGWDPGDPALSPAEREAKDESGRYLNQQRFSILGIGNNVGIRVIAFGLCLVVAGIPWAFYVKPWLVRRKARRFAAGLPERGPAAAPTVKRARRERELEPV